MTWFIAQQVSIPNYQMLYAVFIQTVVVRLPTTTSNHPHNTTAAITCCDTHSSKVNINLTVKTFENKLPS